MGRCAVIRKNGKPCTAIPLKGKDVCLFHASEEEKAAHRHEKSKEFDLEAELNAQLRRVKRLPPSFEKERLVLEITKLIAQLEQEREPQEGQGEPESMMDRIKGYRRE